MEVIPRSTGLAAPARAAAGAVAFLTRVPVGRRVAVDEADVGHGALLFPLVGAGIGAAVGGAALLADAALPPLVAAGVAVAVGALLTGSLHLDALADVADALGARARVQALEIMRDPRIGAFGTTALGLDLIVKVAAVAALLDHRDLVLKLLVAGALSRATAPPLAAALPYARAEIGTGGVLRGRVGAASVLASPALAAAAAVLLLGTTGAAMIASTVLLAVALAAWYRHWLGGTTGDALGAAIEVTETVALLVAVALA
ncbi:MAG TPA: adenosylcobinamide-GDP ribazoletransferase [Gaiellaceae bacterium]|jgi:adenosylcobinamide-GDP ribazoletransferase|nr:adenosylcobinamide-GDP ribazoletransferase [Gaiellaceae bacterium]